MAAAAPFGIARGAGLAVALAVVAALFGPAALGIYILFIAPMGDSVAHARSKHSFSRDIFILILAPLAIGAVLYFTGVLSLVRPALVSIAQFEILPSRSGAMLLNVPHHAGYASFLYLVSLVSLALLSAFIGYYRAVGIDPLARLRAQLTQAPQKGPMLAISIPIFVIAYFAAYGITGPDLKGSREVITVASSSSIHFMWAFWCVALRLTFSDPHSDW